MSHFSVAVHLPAGAAQRAEDVEPAVKRALVPYREYDVDNVAREFLEFEDTEDANREEYETEGCEMVRMPDGRLLHTHDGEFRVPGTYGIGGGGRTHKVPPSLTVEEVKHAEHFETFEEYMKEWHGSDERDPETGRYGQWRNPQGYWDWWVIGGRWRDHVPVLHGSKEHCHAPWRKRDEPSPHKHNTADVARLSAIDFKKIEADTETKVREFFGFWQGFKEAGKDPSDWGDDRSMALRLGLLECKSGDELGVDDALRFKWDRNDVVRYDVVRDPGYSISEFRDRFAAALSQLRTFAYLDGDGWHQPGKMGWFACSSDEPATLLKYAAEFQAWVRRKHETEPESWLAIVDCHV